jgi:hypothetical protein
VNAVDANSLKLAAGQLMSYSNSAEALGIGPVATAGHVSRSADCVNAHRVLWWDTTLVDSYQCHKADEDHDTINLLLFDGISLNDGRVDGEQKLGVKGFLALVEEDEL